MEQHPRLLRKRKNWLQAVGAGRRNQRNEQRRSRKNRERSRHKHLSARAGMATASIPSDAANSRHVIASASGGKYGGAEITSFRRRVEDNLRGSEPNVILRRSVIWMLRVRILIVQDVTFHSGTSR